MKIAVVDDDPIARDHLRACLNGLLGDSCAVEPFSSGEAFLSVWQKGLFDLVILDIFMDRLNGMDVAREIRKTDPMVKLVFSTTSNEFASESYEVNACYYLHKPFGTERVRAMLDRLDLAQMEQLRTVKLPDGTDVRLREIVYADCSAHRVILHAKGGEDTPVRANFSEIESLLCAYPYFFSPSKGFIVNFYEVVSQSESTFVMSDGSRVPISRRKAKQVTDAYFNFRFERVREGGKK
ncbi:MAG TPA: hypothetical protein DCE08_04050 [Ruminococcaceae bacterium]|nr:hypothetical protein [Oscillospiraceae bacterium]